MGLTAIGNTLTRAGIDELIAVQQGLPARPPVETFATGIETLDVALGGGLRRKELTVILADTGIGKSSLTDQIVLEVSTRRRVRHFVLEMGRQRTVARLLAKIMRLEVASVNTLLTHRPDHGGLKRALNELCYERALYLEERDEDALFTVDHVAHLCAQDDRAPDLVVIDDLPCLDGWSQGFPAYGSGKEYVARRDPLAVRDEIVKTLLRIANTLNCAVLIPHQTKAEVVQKNRRPTLGDPADFMGVTRKADTVIGLYRPFRGKITDNVIELLMLKNRNGVETTLHLYRNAKQLRFEDMTADEEAALECCKPRKGRK